jgi:hypothetical protein
MNLLDLPNEILLFILKKMNVVDALFRQSGLHSRLDQLLFDHVYVRELDFTIKSWDDSISPMNDLIIDRVCEKILPYINDKIIKLTLEPNSIERVLRVVDYPKLSSLSLTNFSKKTLQHFTGNDNYLFEINKYSISFLENPSRISGGSRIFVSGGAPMGVGALQWEWGRPRSKKRVMGSVLDLFCYEKSKIFFRNGGDRPQCPPPKSATESN